MYIQTPHNRQEKLLMRQPELGPDHGDCLRLLAEAIVAEFRTRRAARGSTHHSGGPVPSESEREAFDERAGIAEYDGELPRLAAERAALREMMAAGKD